MTPDPALLRTEFLGLTAHFDDVALDREDLALFFSGVSDRYGMGRFEYHPDGGATFGGPDGAEFMIRPGQVSSCGVTRLGLGEGVQRIGGLLGEAVERYSVGPMWLDDATVVAAWDLQEEDAARRLLISEMTRLDDDRLALLGGGSDLALGLRVWRNFGEGSLDCSLEPMHADTSKIYIRLAYSQQDPLADVPAVLSIVDRMSEFLSGSVTEFVLSLARR
jgi:hypothetical protein